VIIKIRQGEIDYFSHIVKKYSGKINKLVTAKLFNKTDVDDLLQNIFLKFYKAIYRFDLNKPVLPYLYQIAKNELKMYYRSHRQSLPLSEELKDEEKDLIMIDDLDNYLKGLSKDQQTVLELLVDGFDHQEIARKLNKPVNTIKTLVRRARLKIKSIHEKNRR